MLWLNLDKEPVGLSRYPNSELRIPDNLPASGTVLRWQWNGDGDIWELLAISRMIAVPTLLIDYLPYSRMDRPAKGCKEFSLRVLADLINSCHFSRVVIAEPHSDVSTALIRNSEPFYVAPTIAERFRGAVDFVFPDAGAEKRYSPFFTGCNQLIGVKQRDFSTGRIERLDVYGWRHSGVAVIIDDLCSYGGTFKRAGNSLREMGYHSINLVTAHTEQSVWDGDLFKADSPIDLILTTDSLNPAPGGRLVIHPMQEIWSKFLEENS